MVIPRMVAAVALMVLVAGTGCIAVVSHKSLVTSHRDAVVFDGQVYVVDTKDGSVMKVDPAALENAEVFVSQESEGGGSDTLDTAG